MPKHKHTMKKPCAECGEPSNVAYIYRKKGRVGEWVAIGRFCTECGHFAREKKLKLSEGIRANASASKDERKKV